MLIRKLAGRLPLTVTLTVLPATEPGEGGEVTLQTAAGRRIGVALTRRHFRVLQLLVQASFEDASVDSELRGLRSVAAIRRAYAGQVQEVATIQPESLRRYVMEIRAAFERALGELSGEFDCRRFDPAQSVIKTVLRRGYQIGPVSFVYVDYAAKPPATSTPISTSPSTPISA